MAELIDLCYKIFSEENNKIENIILEYSYTHKILLIFTDLFFYVIDNSKTTPNLKSKIKFNLAIKFISLHPKSQNQLIIITKEDFVFLIEDLKEFSKPEQIQKLNLNLKNIISIKFSNFDNFFGILYDKNKFNLYYLNHQNEELMLSEKLDTNYIDFSFCPQFSLGFDMFMIFFMTKNGELNMYGPFFPKEFSVKKEFFFNMNNFLLYKLNTMKNNDLDYQKYAISLAIVNDLKNSLINESKDDYIIKISEKIQRINATFKKRNIFVNNNFLTNINIMDILYKQIYILDKRPLTVLRISENNNIDIIILSDEIFPELANIGNIVSNNDIKINNYLIEFIQLNNNNNRNCKKDLIKIIQYENQELFIKTNDSLFLVQIPYLNELKKAVEENIMFIPNKIRKTSITKLFKWNKEIYKLNIKNKIIEIKNILIIPELRLLYIFGILKEKIEEFGRGIKEIRTIIIKKSSFKNTNIINNLTKFKDIFKPKKSNDLGDDIDYIKLNEIDVVKNEVKNMRINLDKKLLEDSNDSNQFEQQLNDDLKYLFKIYINLLQNNDEFFLNEINIMKKIYNDLSNSKIKKSIDDTNKKIIALKTLKEKINKNNELISQKINSINEKINKYELTDEETENYLKILIKYQKEMNNKLYDIEKRIKFCYESLNKNYSYKDLFPNNDLDFTLIEKSNQKKYLKMEEEINNKSKELFIKLQK